MDMRPGRPDLRGAPACAGRCLQSSATAAGYPSRAPSAAPAAALVWAPAKQTRFQGSTFQRCAMEGACQLGAGEDYLCRPSCGDKLHGLQKRCYIACTMSTEAVL